MQRRVIVYIFEYEFKYGDIVFLKLVKDYRLFIRLNLLMMLNLNFYVQIYWRVVCFVRVIFSLWLSYRIDIWIVEVCLVNNVWLFSRYVLDFFWYVGLFRLFFCMIGCDM